MKKSCVCVCVCLSPFFPSIIYIDRAFPPAYVLTENINVHTHFNVNAYDKR